MTLPASDSISDVPGLKVGHAHDATVCTGVSVVLFDRPAAAAADIRGGGTGTRETEALSLAGSVDEVHALVLAGGSAFGLAAGDGTQAYLAELGLGFRVGSAHVPIVPTAILFDLLNGGDKLWGANAPYGRLGREACEAAGQHGLQQGSVGAGYGATTATLRGGLGTASAQLGSGIVVGAMVAVNAVGSVMVGDTPHFWAAPFEVGDEFGGRGFPSPMPVDALVPRMKGAAARSTAPQSTTIGIVATNARLSKRGAHRLAVMAQTGLARAVVPVHTPLDGDLLFAASTGLVAFEETPGALAELGAMAATVVTRAIARGVYWAAPAPDGWAGPPAYRSVYGIKT